MTPAEALSLGMFAINTILAPDASSDEDVAKLDAQGHEAVAILAQLRDSALGLERALPDLSPEARCTYCRAFLHRADSVSKWEDETGSPYCPAEGQRWHGAEPVNDDEVEAIQIEVEADDAGLEDDLRIIRKFNDDEEV